MKLTKNKRLFKFESKYLSFLHIYEYHQFWLGFGFRQYNDGCSAFTSFVNFGGYDNNIEFVLFNKTIFTNSRDY